MPLKNLILFLTFTSVIFISCQSENTETEQKSYQQTKEILLDKEQKNPANFITASSNDKKNLLGQTVIKGKVTNHATVAVYKDVEIKMFFYSKTRALLDTETETVFEELKPGQSKDFKTKYFAPKGSDSVGIQVLNAKAVEQ